MSTVRRARAVGADHRVLHRVAAVHAVGNRMQLTGIRVALRMRGVAAGQRAVEVARADGVEFVGELDVGDAGLDERERLAGMPDHVGVRADTGQPEVAGAAAARRALSPSADHAPIGCGTTRPCRRGCGCRAPCRRRRTSGRARDRSRRSGSGRCAGTGRRGSPGSVRPPPDRSACTHGRPARTRPPDSGSSSRHLPITVLWIDSV